MSIRRQLLSPRREIRMAWTRIAGKMERNGKILDIFNTARLNMRRRETSLLIPRFPA